MAFCLSSSESVDAEVRRVAEERLDHALLRLRQLPDAEPGQVEELVHAVRKRCKELRGLLRLIRPTLGDDFGPTNRAIREAAKQLSSIRDAQALLNTFRDLRAARFAEDDRGLALDSVYEEQAQRAAVASRTLGEGDPRLAVAYDLLAGVREGLADWDVPDGFRAFAPGIERTYRRGRDGFARARRKPNDERIHEWRKAVKYLWYQMRLIESVAPSVLGPLVERLDDLAGALGDDHDLAVLVERLESDPESFGDRDEVSAAIELSRARQSDLRERAFGLGARLYAEKPKPFVARMRTYWKISRRQGPERRAGSIAELWALDADHGEDGASLVERERKFLVADRPEPSVPGDRIRQGYLAVDGPVSVRIRDRDGLTMTVKGGVGSTRTELEWHLRSDQFNALWEHTAGRSIDKTRYRLPVGAFEAELDVFAGALEGLWLVEVEFADEESMAAFDPPPWFGTEVTDDVRYTNAHLAANGLPDAVS